MSKDYFFTSESVSEGHPDKVADQISDAIVDAILEQDKHSRIAAETLVTTGLVMLAGEITTNAKVDYARVARETIRRIGYACDETPSLMPMPIYLAHRLVERQSLLRKDGRLPWLRPDAKSQVTLKYINGKPDSIDTVVLSTQHNPEMAEDVGDKRRMKQAAIDAIIEDIIQPVLPKELVKGDIKYLVNPTGCFEIGGPHGDAGLTGRKIIVDTYGGAAPHGGGAFSGKDPSKVDRSAAYAARYVAKNIVAAGLAGKCLVQVSYAIGVARPTSVMVETYGTGKVSDEKLTELVLQHFDLRPKGIVAMLDLLRPIYRKTAAYGHFGRDEPEFTWENTDKASALRADAGL